MREDDYLLHWRMAIAVVLWLLYAARGADKAIDVLQLDVQYPGWRTVFWMTFDTINIMCSYMWLLILLLVQKSLPFVHLPLGQSFYLLFIDSKCFGYIVNLLFLEQETIVFALERILLCDR